MRVIADLKVPNHLLRTIDFVKLERMLQNGRKSQSTKLLMVFTGVNAVESLIITKV